MESPKDQDPLGNPGVYEIPCDCGKAYIGETGRNVSTRVLEHIRSVKKMDSKNSAVAEYAHDEGASHFIRFDRARVLVRGKRFVPRKIREPIEIGRHSNFNRDSGWVMPPAWKPVIPRLKFVCDGKRVDTVSSVCLSSVGLGNLLHASTPAQEPPATTLQPPAPPPQPPASARELRALRRSMRRVL